MAKILGITSPIPQEGTLTWALLQPFDEHKIIFTHPSDWQTQTIDKLAKI